LAESDDVALVGERERLECVQFHTAFFG
jgi:hypothetical protein